MQTINDVNREIGKILTDNPVLRSVKADDPDYGTIVKDNRSNSAVVRLLNEYEFVCLGGNKGLLDSEIIGELRGHAIRNTWIQFKNYILSQRELDRDAWNECEKWLGQNNIAGWEK